MSNKKLSYQISFYSLVALVIIVATLALTAKCNAQFTIPMVKGTIEEGNVIDPGEDPSEPFELFKSTMEATSTDVKIEFRRKEYERPSELNYLIDSLDISGSTEDGYEEITLWVNNDTYPKYTEKIIILSNNITYKMYIHYRREIFYFSGKVH